jgi:hypothetical protein
MAITTMIYATILYEFSLNLYSMRDEDVYKYIGLILLYRRFENFKRAAVRLPRPGSSIFQESIANTPTIL